MNKIEDSSSDSEELQAFSKQRFDKCLLRVLKSNPGVDSIAGLGVLATICERIQELEPKVNSMVDRAMQTKTRTIFSQNTEVHNRLFSLQGAVENLIESMGFV